MHMFAKVNIIKTIITRLQQLIQLKCQLLSANPLFTHASAFSIRRFYPPFTRCYIRRSAHPQIRFLPVPLSDQRTTWKSEDDVTCSVSVSYMIQCLDYNVWLHRKAKHHMEDE